LLAEAGVGGVLQDLVSGDAQGIEADWDDVELPEAYLGYERSESFASPGGLELDERRVYGAPPRRGLNKRALAGGGTLGATGRAAEHSQRAYAVPLSRTRSTPCYETCGARSVRTPSPTARRTVGGRCARQ